MAPPLVHTTASLSFPAKGRLRVAIVADTHSRPHPELGSQLETLRPDAILHAGDIGSLEVLDGLARIAPLYAVRGNIDVHAPGLPDLLTLDLEREGQRVLRLLLLHIAVAGPRLRSDAAGWAKRAGASLVVCGHSHVPFIGFDRGIAVFNPGSVGPRRFTLPIVYGVLELGPGGAEGLRLSHVDVETGRPWLPPG